MLLPKASVLYCVLAAFACSTQNESPSFIATPAGGAGVKLRQNGPILPLLRAIEQTGSQFMFALERTITLVERRPPPQHDVSADGPVQRAGGPAA
jgi:hypothetical protein